MTSVALLLALAVGQFAPAPTPDRPAWLDTVHNGRPVKVLGWYDAYGRVTYFNHQNTHLSAPAPAPTPAPAPARAAAPVGPPSTRPVPDPAVDERAYADAVAEAEAAAGAALLPGVRLGRDGKFNAGLDLQAPLSAHAHQLETNDADFARKFWADRASAPDSGERCPNRDDPPPTPQPWALPRLTPAAQPWTPILVAMGSVGFAFFLVYLGVANRKQPT